MHPRTTSLPPSPPRRRLQVLDLLVEKHLHRVYVVDDSGVAISIITLTDILRAVTKPPVVTPPPRMVSAEDMVSDTRLPTSCPPAARRVPCTDRLVLLAGGGGGWAAGCRAAGEGERLVGRWE